MRNIRQFAQTTAAVALLAGAAACGATARGVAQDAKVLVLIFE